MIAIIDYGMGNLRSVQKAFEFLGYEAVITDSADAIAAASHVILPGVGAFEDAMKRIRETQLDQALLSAVNAGKPVLGICLGMQMMFEYSEEEDRFVDVHHPFTSPMDEDLELCEKEPMKARAKAYDIVINGQEAGGGSIRIHRQDIQEKMFGILGFTKEDIQTRFGFFVDAFKYGAPPHGGLALGLDRLAMLISKTDSIKDVIAFPKVQTASCLMTGAPDLVDDKQLLELHVKAIEKEEK